MRATLPSLPLQMTRAVDDCVLSVSTSEGGAPGALYARYRVDLPDSLFERLALPGPQRSSIVRGSVRYRNWGASIHPGRRAR